MKKATAVEDFGNLITAWLKMKNMFFSWKKLILDTLNKLFNENILENQVEWEYLKYNIRKYRSNFSKKLAKNRNKKIAKLETKLKHFKKHYVGKIDCKQQLDAIYEEEAKGINITSKCNWYEHSEKSNKFFLNLEKHNAIQSQIHSVIIKQDEITDQPEINKHTFFYQYLLPCKVQIQTDEIQAYSENIPLPKPTKKQALSCESIMSEDEMFKSWRSMENNKSPGN